VGKSYGYPGVEPRLDSDHYGSDAEPGLNTQLGARGYLPELLMPSPLVQRIIDSAAPSLQLIERIARRFHTSLSAVAWRYCDLAQEKWAIVDKHLPYLGG
jgi:hypothetical protein